MNNGINPFETEDEIERASVAARADAEVDHPRHKRPSENECASYNSDTGSSLKVAMSKKKGLIAEKADSIYAGPTQAVPQTQIEETLVDILQLGNNAASYRTKTDSTQFLETIVIECFSRGTADDVVLQCFERWSQSDTFLKAIVKRIVSNAFFIRSVAGFMKNHVD